MKLSEFRVYRVGIPFKIRFGHAAASRERSDSVVVRLAAEDGTVGVGESAPREYVTGETSESAFNEIGSAGPGLAEALSAAEPMAVLRDELPSRIKGNAARCAVELAVLDLLGKSLRKSIPELLGRKVIPGFRPRYSGVIGAGSARKVAWAALKMRVYGFNDVKIKVGVDFSQDVRIAKAARFVLGRRVDIRADANGAWTSEDAERTVRALLPFGISCIEQPLAKDRDADLPLLRRKINVPIMLDESLCTMDDARRAVERGECDLSRWLVSQWLLFNIRISKCGGLIGSLDIADYAEKNGVRCQLGCQVGETGILSAAGRLFSAMVPGLIHLEGSYERHLLSDDITRERVRFGYGGWADPLPGPGLGVSVDEERLSRYAERVLDVKR